MKFSKQDLEIIEAALDNATTTTPWLIENYLVGPDFIPRVTDRIDSMKELHNRVMEELDRLDKKDEAN